MRTLRWLLLVAAAAMFALHYLHLKADFPWGTPWMDWAKYTDEGWYGDAAIRFFQNGGRWFVPGDFNPAVALPVWPVLEGLLFRVTGVSVVAARALSVSCFGAASMCAAVLLRRTLRRLGAGGDGASAAAAGLLLIAAASPFLYAFSRMAILEPLLLLAGLGALLVADAVQPERWGRAAVALGALLPVMVLTKTTAVFLLPAVLWAMWARAGFGWRGIRVVVVAGAIGLGLWGMYYGLVVRPHFLEDYRYLFSANGYTGITLATAWSVIGDTLRDGRWVGAVVAVAAVAATAVAGVLVRGLRREPVWTSLLLWVAGYLSFLAYHDNLQPRYYLVVALPLLTLGVMSVGGLWLRGGWGRGFAVVGVVAMAWATAAGAWTTIGYVRAPQYSFLHAAEEIARVVRADPRHSQLLLSVSGADVSLMTGLPSICDDFGTEELDDRVEQYRPGWYAAWNYVEDDKMDAIAPLYHPERVAAIPAYDDPERNLLVLYRLDTAGEHRRAMRRARKAVPRRLRTKSGQQPSAEQLEH